MRIPKRIQLYNAAVWAGYQDPAERSADEWWDRAGDFALDDARTALEMYIEMRLDSLKTAVVNAARRYRKEDSYGNTLAIDAAIEALEKFEEEYALDHTGKPLE